MGNSCKKYDVVCFGIVVSDILIKGVRDNVMDYETDVAESVTLCTGGDALNEAMTCSRLGLRTALAGSLGDDFFGDYVLKSVQGAGVATEGIFRSKEFRTATNIALIGENGKRCILSAPNTNMDAMDKGLSDAALDVIRNSKIGCIGSLFVSKSLDVHTVQEIYRAAKEAGAIVVADATFPSAMDQTIDELYECIDGLDYFVPSYDEGSRMTGKTDPLEIAKDLLAHVNKAIVLKLGAEGCLVCSKEGDVLRIPAYRVDAIDTTGAGDNFVAGFLWGLSRNLPLEECCKAASATGAIATTQVGANGAVKSAAQVLEFMD